MLDANSPTAAPSNSSASLITDLEQQLRVFKTLSSIIDFAYTFDARGRFLYANQALLDLLGLTLEQITGKNFLELPYPNDLAVKLQAQIQQVFDTRERLIDVTPYTNPAGMTGYYEYIFNPVFDENGAVEIVAGSTREVTHRKLNEESFGRLAAIVDSSDDAIVSKDLTGIVKSWNKAAETIFGYSAAEMVGTSILRIIPPHLLHEEDLILSKITAGERIEHYETMRLRKNGESVDVSLTVSPIKDSSGIVIGTSKIARDISARKQMERKLVQAEKIATMGRMAATIAHELNNPLEAITNLVFLARDSSKNNENKAALDYLAAAEREIERVSHLTQLALGYYSDTNLPSSVACHELIDEALRVYQSKIETRNIVVETVCNTHRPVLASKGEMMHVMSNLIANSVDAMPNGGHLRFQVNELDGARIEILVQDEGHGIAPQDLSRIFEPFFTTKGNLATGVGLWVTKQLVEKHGGDIQVASNTAPLRGTTVRVSLPFLAPTHAPHSPLDRSPQDMPALPQI
jgi:PAS domain S-box-containing protein